MDGGALKAAVHGVAEGQTRLSDFTFTFHFHALEKEMATHSSVLAWRIPGAAEPWWTADYGVAQSWTRLKWLSSSSSKQHHGLPRHSDREESTCNAGDPGLTPSSGRSPAENNGYLFQYSFLENFLDREAWRAIVHGVTKSKTQRSN